jgi:hypothetical protein
MPYDSSYRWNPASGVADYGASITAMTRLAHQKGYVLVGCGAAPASDRRHDLMPPAVGRTGQAGPSALAAVLRRTDPERPCWTRSATQPDQAKVTRRLCD